MSDRDPLSPAAVRDALHGLSGWRYEDDQLKKTFELSNFRAAMSFMVRLSYEAEALDHHPELRNVYNRVEVALSTHDAGNKVTQMDLRLARAIEGFNWV